MVRPSEGGADAHEALRRIVDDIRGADESDLGDLGAGPLESLLLDHEEELWPEIERLARSDPRFRRALRGVWAYGSPKYAERHALLWELGEWTQISVRFVGSREGLSPEAPLTEWRAVEIDGAPLDQVVGLLGDLVRGYESGAWGPGHRDHPDEGVKLLTSPDLDPVRTALEKVATDAGLALIAPADWEIRNIHIGEDPRDRSDIKLKVRHHPDRTPNPIDLAKDALPAIADLARGQSVAGWGVRIVLSVALPGDGHLSYVFVLGSPNPRGLRYETLPEAIAAIPPHVGRPGAQYMWGTDGWHQL